MQRELSATKKAVPTNRQGFSLVEAIIAVAVFSVFVGAVATNLVLPHKYIFSSGLALRAAHLAEEGLEATRNIRDSDWANLTDGTHGLATGGASWSFSGSQDSPDIFTRKIKISSINDDTKEVESEITWVDKGQSKILALKERLTNWRKKAGQLLVDVSQAEVDSADHTQVIGITMENIGDEDITITKMKISWTDAPNGNKLKEIHIDGDSVWSGNNGSGDTEDITDFLLAPGQGNYPINYLDFSKDMVGSMVTIIFTLLDETTYSVTFSLVEGSHPTDCNEYCNSLKTYAQGACSKGKPPCLDTGGTLENGGNKLCIQTEGGVCCCKP